jgi:hypothetical protein
MIDDGVDGTSRVVTRFGFFFQLEMITCVPRMCSSPYHEVRQEVR